ncbi:transposase family protein [Nonomuraea sp. NPDC050786]|uniref:transposase family protein n=1 Tax=Nonomuraea sp. NPDC050786 TaxID=3154840 RepID=UPI0033EED581
MRGAVGGRAGRGLRRYGPPRLPAASRDAERRAVGPRLLRAEPDHAAVLPTRRRTGKDNRKNYSRKHNRHGLHFLALTDGRGRLIWISAARPGRTHDITAARHDHIVEHLRAAGRAPSSTASRT